MAIMPPPPQGQVQAGPQPVPQQPMTPPPPVPQTPVDRRIALRAHLKANVDASALQNWIAARPDGTALQAMSPEDRKAAIDAWRQTRPGYGLGPISVDDFHMMLGQRPELKHLFDWSRNLLGEGQPPPPPVTGGTTPPPLVPPVDPGSF